MLNITTWRFNKYLKIHGCRTASDNVLKPVTPIVLPISVNSNSTCFVAQAQNLGVILDFTLNFKIYI